MIYSTVWLAQAKVPLFTQFKKFLKSFFPRPALREQDGSQWCLVGNIAEKTTFGEEGEERSGTKHFSPGTKVYCLPAQWGDGYEKIVVLARHRGSRKLAEMVIKSDWVCNWRAQVVYKPSVLKQIARALEENGRANWQSKEEVESYLESIRKYEAKRDVR